MIPSGIFCLVSRPPEWDLPNGRPKDAEQSLNRSVSFSDKSSIFALSRQSNIFRKRNPPTSGERTKEETLLNYGK